MTDARVATGWEPGVPLDDSLLRQFLFTWAGACAAFAGPAGGATVRTDDVHATDYRRPGSFFNSATLLRPPDGPDHWDRVVGEVDAFYDQPGAAGEYFLWSAWPTPDLSARGWFPIGHPPLLVRPPAAVLPPPPGPAGVVVDTVTDADDLAAWETVVVDGYPAPELAGAEPGRVVDPAVLADPRVTLSLGRPTGRDGGPGQPVSIGALYTDNGLGLFVLGVTLPVARQQGHWAAHAAHRLGVAPDVWMTGVFSDYSRSSAQKAGFVPLLRLTLWGRARG